MRFSKLAGSYEVVVKRSIGSLLIKAFSMATSFLIVIVLASILGPEGYGVYVFALSLIAVISIPSQVGLPLVIVRETAKAQVNKNWYLIKKLWVWSNRYILISSICSLFVGCLLGLFGGFLLNEEQKTVLLIGLVTIPLVAFSYKYSASIQGLNFVVLAQVPDKFIRPILLLALIFIINWAWEGHKLTPVYTMVIYSIVTLIVLVVSVIILKKVEPKEIKEISKSYDNSPEWRKSTLVLTTIGGLSLLNSHMDIIMLGILSTDGNVGVYRVIFQLGSLIVFGLAAISQVLQPHLARIHKQGDIVELQKIVTFSSRVILIISLPPVLILLFYGDWVLLTLFGDQYKDSAVSLNILVFGQIFNVAMGPVGIILNMTGNERHAVQGVGIALILNLVLNFLLIPVYGVVGATIATSVSLFVWNVILRNRVRSKLGVEPSIFGNIF